MKLRWRLPSRLRRRRSSRLLIPLPPLEMSLLCGAHFSFYTHTRALLRWRSKRSRKWRTPTTRSEGRGAARACACAPEWRQEDTQATPWRDVDHSQPTQYKPRRDTPHTHLKSMNHTSTLAASGTRERDTRPLGSRPGVTAPRSLAPRAGTNTRDAHAIFPRAGPEATRSRTHRPLQPQPPPRDEHAGSLTHAPRS